MKKSCVLAQTTIALPFWGRFGMIVTNVAEGWISVSSLLSATSCLVNSGVWSRHLLGHSQGLSAVMIPLLPLFKMCVSSRLCSSIKKTLELDFLHFLATSQGHGDIHPCS